MAVRNPKNKGNTFERKVASMFSKWAGVKFMRTPGSGAIHNFRDKRVVSDIVPPLSLGNFPFSIECKNVMCSWEFSSLLEGTSQTLNLHWKQCVEDSKREQLIPLLVFTKNFRNTFAIMPLWTWLYISKEKIPHLALRNVSEFPVILFRLKDFLSRVSIEEVLSLDLLKISDDLSDEQKFE